MLVVREEEEEALRVFPREICSFCFHVGHQQTLRWNQGETYRFPIERGGGFAAFIVLSRLCYAIDEGARGGMEDLPIGREFAFVGWEGITRIRNPRREKGGDGSPPGPCWLFIAMSWAISK